MPELPEVETIANALRPYLLGRRICSVDTFVDKLRYPLDSIRCSPDIIGSELQAVSRRAKYICATFANRSAIVLHLGMTGSCRIDPVDQARRRHDHVCFNLDNRTSWRFNDPRRFGLAMVDHVECPDDLPDWLMKLPPEPLGADFHVGYLRRILAHRNKPIKSALLDNHLFAGIGNIYACESLFRARIHPLASCGRLSRSRMKRLVSAIREVMLDAVRAGGTTFSDFRTVDGTEGKFARELRVYGRDGQPCQSCGSGVIKRVVTSGRSTYYCGRCQRR